MFYLPLICKNVFLNQGMSVVWHLLSNTPLTRPFPKIRDKGPSIQNFLYPLNMNNYVVGFLCFVSQRVKKIWVSRAKWQVFVMENCDYNIKWQSMCIGLNFTQTSRHKGYHETVKGLNPDLCIILLYSVHGFIHFILLHEKFLQFAWLRTVVFLLNLKYLHVKITNLFWVVV